MKGPEHSFDEKGKNCKESGNNAKQNDRRMGRVEIELTSAKLGIAPPNLILLSQRTQEPYGNVWNMFLIKSESKSN